MVLWSGVVMGAVGVTGSGGYVSEVFGGVVSGGAAGVTGVAAGAGTVINGVVGVGSAVTTDGDAAATAGAVPTSDTADGKEMGTTEKASQML